MPDYKIPMKMFNKIRDIENSRHFLNIGLPAYYLRVIRTWIFKKFIIKRQFLSHSIASVNMETYCFCNRKCYFCFFHERFPKREQGIMEEKTYKKIIDGLVKINFCGRVSPHNYGEPLMDKRLPSLIEYTRKKLPNCFIYIATNGDFLTDQLFRTLINKGVDHFFITDYDDKEKPFLQYISVKCPIHVTLRKSKFIKQYDRAGKIYNRKLALSNPCLRPSSQLLVNWKGDVILCCNDFYGDFVIGNVNDADLMDIWHSPKFNHYREMLRRGERSKISLCKYCDNEGDIPW